MGCQWYGAQENNRNLAAAKIEFTLIVEISTALTPDLPHKSLLYTVSTHQVYTIEALWMTVIFFPWDN